jgi:hypothetical protein
MGIEQLWSRKQFKKEEESESEPSNACSLPVAFIGFN